jgi:hypothetical protein
MSGEIPPPQAIPSHFLRQQQMQNPIAQMQEVQQMVSKLPSGTQIVALITGADRNNNLVVRIGGSELLLSSPFALAKGAQLTLKVVNTSDNVAFQLISVDGKLPPTQAQTVSNFLQNPTPNVFLKPLVYDALAQKFLPVPQALPQGAGAQTQTQTISANYAAPTQAVIISNLSVQTFQGIVLSPAPEAIKLLSQAATGNLPADKAQQFVTQLPQNLGQGARIDFQISNIQAPQTQANATLQPQNSVQNSNSQNPVDTSNSVLKGQDFQRAANEQLLRDSGFVPKITTSPEGKVSVSAQIVALNGGQAVVETALGRLVIPAQLDSASNKIGTILNLDIQKIATQAADLEQTAIKDLFTQWPALKALQNSLSQTVAHDALSKLAGLDSIFASRMAGFFKAVKENNLDNWLSIDLLRKLTPETADALKAKMTGDFANFTRLYSDNSNSGWHTVLLPVYDGKELQQANFYVKDLQDEDEQNSGKRFVVEFTTGGFGDIQLDGLVRKNAAQNRFDLMVRTAEQLPEDVRMGITEIFTNTAEVTGVKGSVDFARLDGSALRPANAVLREQMDHSGISI